MGKTFFVLLTTVTALLVSCQNDFDPEKYKAWEVYGGGNESIRYSSLDQIHTGNVSQLTKAWTYHTGDADTARSSQMQCNPIVVNGTLYATSPRLKLLALNAATGSEKWVFDPLSDTTGGSQGINNNRGVTYWEDGNDQRILYTAGSTLYAIDAVTGKPIADFGDNGRASLKQGLPDYVRELHVSATSPGIVYQDLLIIGSRVSEGADAASGDIRAFSAKTGELEWVFHTVPRPGEFGYDTWEDPDAWKRTGGANSWAGMSLDEERGIVYIPTGSASPDFYGGNRKGANLFANSLLALDAATGERVWHYQTIRHDLWDRDLPSPPSLVTVRHEGELIDAVAQTTKTGYVFLFNRETGEPLFPIEEQPVPTDTELYGEQVWPEQPMPQKPAPFTRQRFTEEDINPHVSEVEKEQIKSRLQQLDSDHSFAPPSLNGIVMFPGFDGGAEWGGNAFDPETGILYVNSNEVPWIMTMVESGSRESIGSEAETHSLASGKDIYRQHCMSCHGGDRKGSGNNPSILNVNQQYQPDELLELINNGRRMMPGFNYLEDSEKKSIVNFLLNEIHYQVDTEVVPKELGGNGHPSTPYTMTGYKKFRTAEGYPAVSPPWGTLNAIDLNSGEYAWRIPLGEYPELKNKGIPVTGTENYGGPVVTAGGLVFIASTLDRKIRAFKKDTGELLWESTLPAAGFATPAVYEIEGRQYLVIACGGGKLGVESGDAYVAFALPR